MSGFIRVVSVIGFAMLFLILGGLAIWWIGSDTFSLTWRQSTGLVAIFLILSVLNDVVDYIVNVILNP
jgi:hypothetical protein